MVVMRDPRRLREQYFRGTGKEWQRSRQVGRSGSESPHSPAKEWKAYSTGLGSERSQYETRDFRGYFSLLLRPIT